MGEAPALFIDDDLQMESKGSETTSIVGDKMYVIGRTCNTSTPSIEVQIFDRSSGEWIVPIVLGTKPKQCKGHSAVLLNDDRILVVKAGSSSDDSTWFLEVNTEFVKEQKKKYETEVVTWSKGVIGEVEKPIVISGPSGVGKGTLIAKLMKEFPSMFGFSVSHTTRSPREKEIGGVHYHFSERNAMEKDINDGKFLEFASVHGNLYGTSVEAVEVVADEGKRCILDIDVQGARSVRASSLEAIFIFISPPSFEELEKRLRERKTETEEQIQKRLRNANAELKAGQAPGLFDNILVNDDLDVCYENLKKLLGLAETIATAPKLSSELVNLPLDHQLSKIDKKIFISYATTELEKPLEYLSVLDVSSLKGGAPGRTRGLFMYAIDSFSNGSDELKKTRW